MAKAFDCSRSWSICARLETLATSCCCWNILRSLHLDAMPRPLMCSRLPKSCRLAGLGSCGGVTCHGPGQLVGYPIFDLRGFSRQPSAISPQENPEETTTESLPTWRKTLGAVDYVRRLEEVLIRTCGDFGILSRSLAGLTGVWTQSEPAAK